MKETLKFLKFGLIGVASVTAISTLAISCNKSEDNKVDTNNQEQIKQTLQKAKDAFTLTPKGNHSQVFASDIKNEVELEKYFDIKGKMEDVTYQFLETKPSGQNGLEVKYRLSYKGVTKEKTISLTGFRDVNWIDYNLENPDDFFKIALDKEHLNTIAFFAQEYNFYTQDMFKTWTLTDQQERYEATKTDQYLFFNNSKYYIWKINFKNTKGLEPIIAELANQQHLPGKIEAVFTPKGEQKNPFLFAVKETVKEN